MANFNFTVRATDSDGAYADRNFGITINNTRVERYMVTDATNAYTSPDLVNWTTRNASGGNDCIYGNNMWLINNMAAGTFANWIIRKSPDGVNYTNVTSANMTFVTASGSTFTPGTNMMFGRMSFANGYFFVPYSSTYGTTPGAQFVLRSVDGIAWTVLASPALGGFFYDSSMGYKYRTFQRVEGSGTDLFMPNFGQIQSGQATADCYGWRSSDNGLTWIKVLDSTGKSNNTTNISSSFLTRINGLYIAATNNTNYVPFMISNDGYNWSPCTNQNNTLATSNANNIFYANGVLYATMNARASGASVSTNYYLASTDGITWNYNVTGTTANFNTTGEVIISSIYKNGFVAFATSAPAVTADKRFSYVFAGSGDSLTLTSSPVHSTSTGPQVPFNFPTGIAAMGS